MTGADAVVAALKNLGVKHAFGIVSIHNMPIFDAINRDGSIRIIDSRHEMAATHAADGYARATGNIGVVIASTGPGTTNTLTGLYEANYASSPVLLITGQAETAFYGRHMGYVHESENQMDLLRAVTRRAESPRLVQQIEPAIIQVANDMLSGRRGPGAVEIPIDLQYQPVDITGLSPAPVTATDHDVVALNQAVELINNASRRLIIAGGGVIQSGAGEQLQRLAEQLDCPVFTTANGRGSIPEDHPLCLGNLFGSRRLHGEMSDCELTIAIGTRFQVGVGGSGAALTPPGRLLHIDIDPGVPGRVHVAIATLLGDAAITIGALNEAMNPSAGDSDFKSRLTAGAAAVKHGLRKRIGPDYEAIMDCMRNELPRDANIVRDTTVPAYNFGNQLLPIYSPRTFIGPNSGAIGPGLPLAIGAAVANNKPTLVIHGDGGFMLHATELATAAQYQLPMIVCVFNDGGYGVLRGLQSSQFDGRMGEVDLGYVDFKQFAESMGVEGYNVTSATGFEDAFTAAVASGMPSLLNIDMRALQPMQGSMPVPE